MRSVSCLFCVLSFVCYGDKAGGSLFDWRDITIEMSALDSAHFNQRDIEKTWLSLDRSRVLTP